MWQRCKRENKERERERKKKKRAKAENGGGGNNLNPGSNVNYYDNPLVLLLDIVANMSSGSLPDGWDERVSRSTGELTRRDHMQFPQTSCMPGRKCASGRSARSEFRMSFS